MKKFRFRLEPILRLKAHREKEKQKIHGQAQRNVLSQQELLATIRLNRRNAQDEKRKVLQGMLDIDRLLFYSRYFMKLRRDEFTGREMLAALKQDAERKRIELLEAARQRKIYEKLKEKRKDSFLKNYERQDLKENDEIAGRISTQKKSP